MFFFLNRAVYSRCSFVFFKKATIIIFYRFFRDTKNIRIEPRRCIESLPMKSRSNTLVTSSGYLESCMHNGSILPTSSMPGELAWIRATRRKPWKQIGRKVYFIFGSNPFHSPSLKRNIEMGIVEFGFRSLSLIIPFANDFIGFPRTSRREFHRRSLLLAAHLIFKRGFKSRFAIRNRISE